MTTVQNIRHQLSAEVNARYRDYQIDRWIRHKAGDETAVLRTISNQKLNEDKLRDILRDQDRPGSVFELLDANFMVFVPNPSAQELLSFTHCAREPRVTPEVFGQMLLVTHYYLLGRLEELYGDGATASLIQDHRGLGLNLNEMKTRTQLVGEIGGRSFPFMISHVHVVNDWGGWTKSSVNAFLGMKKPSGATTALCSDQELSSLYDLRLLPAFLGGSVDPQAIQPEGCGTMIKSWFLGGGLSRLQLVPEGFARTRRPPPPPPLALERPLAPPFSEPEAHRAGALLSPRLLARPIPMPQLATASVLGMQDIALRLVGIAVVLVFVFIDSVFDVLLLVLGGLSSWYTQALLGPVLAPSAAAGGAEAEEIRAVVVRRGAEECEGVVRAVLGEVDFRDRVMAAEQLGPLLAERLKSRDSRTLELWVKDVSAVWPSQLLTATHRPTFERWVVFYRWLQAANTAVADPARQRHSTPSPHRLSPREGEFLSRRSATELYEDPHRSFSSQGSPSDSWRNSPTGVDNPFRSKVRRFTKDHLHFRQVRSKAPSGP